MFEKLVERIVGAAKKNRRLLIPAVVCLWVLFSVDTVAGTIKKQYGVYRPVALLCCVVVLGVTAVSSTGPSGLVRPVFTPGPQIVAEGGVEPGTGGAVRLEAEGCRGLTPPVTRPNLRDEPKPTPNDPEHSDQSVSLPKTAVDKRDPEQNELLNTVTKYVGMLQLNQVTPDWAPDLAVDGPEPDNRVYYEKAWDAYQSLSEENRSKLESETLEYLMTCHRTIVDSHR